MQHKSAMQLQQQQQAVAAQVQGGGHHLGPHGGPLMRAGSSSGYVYFSILAYIFRYYETKNIFYVLYYRSESGAGLSKPHQCQQCLKSFSSNHQLVQHIRVHTGK